LGALYAGSGKIRAAGRCFRKAIEASPQTVLARSNLAITCNYRSDWSPEQVRDAHIEIFRSFGPPADDHANEPDPHRRLRVGYYCAEFRFGPPAFFLPPMLKCHNRDQFEVFCYSSTNKPDEYTAKLSAMADHWRDLREMDDSQAAEQIRADQIDVLVDRTGHFEHGRPSLFALGAAPVQVSLPGYPATTGVPGMGYRITDAYADPPGMTEHLHTETLFRLPNCFACYAPPERAPDVTPLPTLRNGYVTFGCFQKREKITGAAIALWSEILAAVPGSRLTFHHLFSGIQEVPREFRRAIEAVFRKRGVEADRLSWTGGQPLHEHLESVASADIALDTYPYNGMTTTCECLWMGVPVLTRAGRAHVSRVGVSYLSNVGLFDWIAASDREYVDLAVRHAVNLPALEKTRRNLRSAMRASPLTDAPSFTANLESAFRAMWRSWCARRTGAASAAAM
jgi:predicted O-linked N-acetylglucosamine transferase (SPINDLY family)